MHLLKGVAGLKILKKSLALAVALCLATVFFASTVNALSDNNCCIAECFCLDCSCIGDCPCHKECDCLELKCFVCEAIVKRREIQEQQIMVVMPCIMDICPFSTKTTLRFDATQICTASIIEDKVRMNN